MKPFHVGTILLSFLLVSCASEPVNAQPEEPAFIIITKNPDDQVSVQYENGAAWIDIQSPTGIGTAAFELESGSMPEKIIFRLYLKGLEEFRLTSAQTKIGASVSSNDQPAISQRLLSSGTETAILPGHPLWMEIEVAPGQAEAYFQISAPQEFIQNAGKMFQIEWIDFYR